MLLNNQLMGSERAFNPAFTNARRLVNGSQWIPLVDGVDAFYQDGMTKLQLAYPMILAFNSSPMNRKGKLFYRIYLPVRCELSFWDASKALYAGWFEAGWHTFTCEYTDVGNTYYIDGVQRYRGPVVTTPSVYTNAASGTFLFDTGNRGGQLPVGCEWW